MSPRLLLVLALLASAPARAGRVVLSPEDWLALQPPEPPIPEVGPGPWIASRELRLTPVEGGVHVHGVWRIETRGHGYVDGVLAPATMHIDTATWNGAPAPIRDEGDHLRLTGEVTGPVVLVIDGLLPGDPTRGAVPIALLPAVRSHVIVDAGTLEAVITSDGTALRDHDGFWTTGSALDLSLVEPSGNAGDRGLLAVAEVGLGVTVGDAEVTGKAHVVWQIRQGSLDEVAFSVPGAGADLDVHGPEVSDWHRDGDRVVVSLRSTQTSQVVVDATWTRAVPAGDEVPLPLPTVVPEAAFRVESTLQLAKDAEIELVPELSGWMPTAAAALPMYGRGLVSGAATASFRAQGSPGGTLELLRFTPVEQPAVVVDSAGYTIATSDEGRVLIRCYLAVRNERAANLHIVPPPGIDLLGVQVSGSPAIPATDGHGGWLVPLRRSLETVDGLLSFPLEVIAIGDTADWDRSEERSIPLFAFDAPVALSRVTLYLPPGYEGKLDAGEDDVVDAFTEGETISYGLAVGDTAQAVADQKFQAAVADWMNNDFDSAQGKLDELRALGAENENVRRLQSNLDVVNEDLGAAEEGTIARRVKEQARVRGIDTENEQQDKLREAEDAYRSGDYDKASSAYNEAIELGKDLAKVEQTEAVEVDTRNASASSGYAMAQKKAEEKSKLKNPEKPSDNRGEATTKGNGGLFGRQSAYATSSSGAGAVADRDLADGTHALVVITDQEIVLLDPNAAPPLDLPEPPPLPDWRDGKPAWIDESTTMDDMIAAAQAEAAGGGSVGGEVGGVAGGVLGGEAYGASGSVSYGDGSGEAMGAVTESTGTYVTDGVTITNDYVQNVPAGRSYESTVETMAGRSRIGLPHVRVGGGNHKEPPVQSPPMMIDIGGDEDSDGPEDGQDAPPDVYAAAMTVVVPALGEAVLYQHLLLPPGQAYALTVRARDHEHKE
jgi:hypothetical protein